ncbi:MAG: HlyD family efflux transporter periplasmic adaptor subunit [Saprospiraceae bacterium]|nr:HlyD family efflux transporter periplasmic adaptor subunit [Saprospiraceae bacterium]
MLNITTNTIKNHFAHENFTALHMVENRQTGKKLLYLLLILSLIILLSMFLPWTQNIRARGYVTALNPEQRPQTINSVIAGRIEKWFVQEGDFVAQGDTILFISEIKDEYFDPNLLANTEQQIKSKELTVGSYVEKVKALDSQIDALLQTRVLKLAQAKNKLQQASLKVQSDSIDLTAAVIQLDIAKEQFARGEQMYKQGLKSLTDLETRRMKMQEAEAKRLSQANKLLTAENEVINARIELTTIEAEFRNKVSNAESDKYTALSSLYDSEAIVTKMQNQYMNYSVRSGLYYITAPQDGYITKAIQAGIGEMVKEGESIISIMPANYDLAVEMYVRPIDLPLVKKGSPVRIQFDGWPAVVFSGWPNVSYGTYGGLVFAMDNFISDNGQYRILVVPDPDDHPWPNALRVGAATSNMALLKDVPIWYELWRQVNGFPPDYYVRIAAKNEPQNKK